MLTTAQRWGIGADLALVRQLGFRHVRLLTMTKGGDPVYDPWPGANFLTFPQPTSDELGNLEEFFQMTGDAGLTHEVVLLMPSEGNLYYQNGVTSADYRAFVDAVFSASWAGSLNRLYLGGDLRLGDVDDDPSLVVNHRQWALDLWPYLVSKCPACSFGVNLSTEYATFWDRGASSLAWIRQSLSPLPSYAGCQLYPSTHAALRGLGFEHDGVVDWSAVARDWITGLRSAAGPDIQVLADEVGLIVGPDFTEADQAAFLQAAISVMNYSWMRACVWEFADHPAIGDYGLFRTDRTARPAAAALGPGLADAAARGLLPGIQYVPPEYDDLAWLLPG